MKSFCLSRVNAEIVRGNIHLASVAQSRKMLDEQRSFKRVGAIVIRFDPLLEGEVVLRSVIIVVGDDGDIVGKKSQKPLGKRGFARARAACYSYK